MTWVQSLVGELRSRKPHGTAKKKKKRKSKQARTSRNVINERKEIRIKMFSEPHNKGAPSQGRVIKTAWTATSLDGTSRKLKYKSQMSPNTYKNLIYRSSNISYHWWTNSVLTTRKPSRKTEDTYFVSYNKIEYRWVKDLNGKMKSWNY